MERLVCRSEVSKLLTSVRENSNRQRIAEIVSKEQFPPSAPLQHLLGDRLASRYWGCLDHLTRELVPRHSSQREVYKALWKLFGEVAANPTRYRHEKFKNTLDKFVEDLKRPLYVYEVAYRIDNLELVGGSPFTLGTVSLFTVTEKYLTNWGIPTEGAGDAMYRKHFLGKPVATLRVQAADADRAFETGLREVFSALDLLRFAAIIGRLPHLDDEMFLWRLSDHSMARQIKPKSRERTLRLHRTFRPRIIDMGPYIAKGLDPVQSGLLAIANGELPEEITGRLKLTIHWISNSVTKEHIDSKIVDLCTALEIMLLPNYKGGCKGEMIALRQWLLLQTVDPGGVLRLYQLRSDIVHEGALGVANWRNYWDLLTLCFLVFNSLVSFSKSHPHIQTFLELVKTLETPEKLRDFLHLFETHDFEGKHAGKVKDVAKKILKGLEVQNQK